MFSIYQFGFKVHENPKMWQEQISNLFDVEFKINTIVNEYPNNEKNWCESICPCLSQLKGFELLGEKIEKIQASFNRYQAYVYLALVFEGDITNKYDFLNQLHKRFKNCVTGFVDNFEIPFKEPESELEKTKYTEVLELGNPVLVVNDFKDDTYTYIKTTIKSGPLYYKFGYNSQHKTKYSRKFKQRYIANEINDEVLEHFHSIFVLFHRSFEFYKEISNMDTIRIILFEISDAFTRIWPIERMKLVMLHRTWRAHLYNKTFFSVLELNAQIDTLINQLVVNNQKISDKYEKQYERVLHNFNIESLKNNKENSKIYDELMDYLKSPYNYRKHSIDKIKSLYEPTDEQICRLRSDNDSRVNLATQGIMGILTIVFFMWGVLSVWYQTAIDYTAAVNDRVLFNSHYWPAIFSLITIGTALISIIIAFFISNRYSKTFTKDVRNMVKCQYLNAQIIELKINKIKDCKHTDIRLLLISELFNIITMFLTINHDEGQLEYFKDKILGAVKEIGSY